jgi:eukaryotic-like serine/threonine-protein kinase
MDDVAGKEDAGDKPATVRLAEPSSSDADIRGGPSISDPAHDAPPPNEAPTPLLPPSADAGLATGTGITVNLPLGGSALRTRTSESGVSESPASNSVHASRARQPIDAALHEEEVHRARSFSLAVVIICGGAMSFLPFLAIPSLNKLLLTVTILAFGATAGWVLWDSRDQRRYTQSMFRFFGWISATMSFPLQYALGMFSPTPLAITLGVSFFGLGIDRRHALLIPMYAITGYFAITLLLILGVLPDHGLVSSAEMAFTSKLFFLLMVPLVLGTTLWMARISRKSMHGAVHRAQEAMRLAGQREAQLVEANQHLEQALRAGAGHGGRYTGTIAGQYRLAEVVGRGAMGEVYAGEHVATNERAAIKLLRADLESHSSAQSRFLREGEIVSALACPNVVQIREIGALADGCPYIAMELLVGEDLATRLRRERQLSIPDLVDMVRQVARGLDAAHGAGIVHRDLKPQNLFCARTSAMITWKILDFGVSKVAGSRGTLTQHAVVGTPRYMSPEQARGNAVGPSSDVFSLGAVIYRALTGRPPFSGPDTPQILFQVVYGMPPRPSELLPDLPREVDSVLALALAKDPDQRLASASVLADALADAARSKIDPELRRQAHAVLVKHSWGTQDWRERPQVPSRRP